MFLTTAVVVPDAKSHLLRHCGRHQVLPSAGAAAASGQVGSTACSLASPDHETADPVSQQPTTARNLEGPKEHYFITFGVDLEVIFFGLY